MDGGCTGKHDGRNVSRGSDKVDRYSCPSAYRRGDNPSGGRIPDGQHHDLKIIGQPVSVMTGTCDKRVPVGAYLFFAGQCNG